MSLHVVLFGISDHFSFIYRTVLYVSVHTTSLCLFRNMVVTCVVERLWFLCNKYDYKISYMVGSFISL